MRSDDRKMEEREEKHEYNDGENKEYSVKKREGIKREKNEEEET